MSWRDLQRNGWRLELLIPALALWWVAVAGAAHGAMSLADAQPTPHVDEDTLIPLGIFLAGIAVTIRAVWWAAQSWTRLQDRIEDLERTMRAQERTEHDQAEAGAEEPADQAGR